MDKQKMKSNNNPKYLSKPLEQHLAIMVKIQAFTQADDFLEVLLNDQDVDALKIRKTLYDLSQKKNRKQPMNSELDSWKEKYSLWEVELVQLSWKMHTAEETAINWLKNKFIKSEIKKIIDKSTDLAVLLDQQNPFCFPNAHHFFDENKLPDKNHTIFDGFHFGDDDNKSIAEVLRNFAAYSEYLLEIGTEDKSFQKKGLNQKIVAYELYKYFISSFGKPHYETVAACVSLMYPDSEIIPTVSHIRSWAGKK